MTDFDENALIDEATMSLEQARFLLLKCRKNQANLRAQILDAREERDDARAQRDQYCGAVRDALRGAMRALGFDSDLVPEEDASP